MPTTGSLIRTARKNANLSQRQLGKRMGCTLSLVSHWEADRKPVTDIPALACALGVSIEAITGDNPPPVSIGEATRADNPIPDGLEEAPSTGHFLHMQALCRWVFNAYGFRISPGRVYEWIADDKLQPPFPAYRNSLRKNPQGEPTLLFKASEVGSWLAQMIQPLKAG